jgi:hypothetical protein
MKWSVESRSVRLAARFCYRLDVLKRYLGATFKAAQTSRGFSSVCIRRADLFY